MINGFIGFLVGSFALLFSIIGIRAIVHEAKLEECQAKLNVTRCIRTIEYVADAGQK